MPGAVNHVLKEGIFSAEGGNLALHILDILFPSNHIIHKSSCGLCLWASDPIIDKFYYNPSIKGSEAQKQRPNKLLWMLWFDGKSISSLKICKLVCTGDPLILCYKKGNTRKSGENT